MSVCGSRERIDVLFGEKFWAAVVFAPRDRQVISFEPMAGITNSLNLAQRGLYHELQSIPPGGRWQESFWVRPSGFGVGSHAE